MQFQSTKFKKKNANEEIFYFLFFYFIFFNIIVDSPLRAFTAVAHTHLAVLALPFLPAPTCFTRLCVESRP